MYRKFNPNPKNQDVGDCTVRAICAATGKEWKTVYTSLCCQGYDQADMPSSNSVWGRYLINRGWKVKTLIDTCPDCYTIKDFADGHNEGTFIIGTGTHVVCVKDGDIWDAWDSSEKIPMYYFYR